MSDVDLVVAGAGGGLAGALRAAERGLHVLVVEASEHFKVANNTAMSTAMIPGAGTRWQRAAGIVDSPDLFVRDVMAKTRGEADERLARSLAEVSAPLVEWMADALGLPLDLATDIHYPGHSVDRCHSIPGRKGEIILGHLVRLVQANDRVDLLVPARVVDVEADAGAVRAAVLELPDGSRETVSTPAVLLATNGFGADRDLVREHLPEIANAVYHGSNQSRGDALRIGTRLGARSAFLDAYQGHAALSANGSTLVGWATIMHGGLMVNLDGERFGDETCGYSEYAMALAQQPQATGWILLDRRIHDACLAFRDYAETVDSGAVRWADDVPGLAQRTGLPEAALARTVADAAAAARGERRDAFGRGHFAAPLSPPYAAVKVVPALFHTQGGLVVDADARVLDHEDAPIRGLYASGGAAMGISGHGAAGYLAGNGLLPAFGLAYRAADHVAGELLPSRRVGRGR